MQLETQDFPTGVLRLNLEDRAGDGSGGPAIRVYGPTEAGQNDWQLLRFDCFKVEPHYHYDPDGRDEQIMLAGEAAADSLAWSLAQLRTNLPTMVRHAGGTDAAVEAASSPEVENALSQIAAALGRA